MITNKEMEKSILSINSDMTYESNLKRKKTSYDYSATIKKKIQTSKKAIIE
jgi:hypothetical protein